jgi:hypothetical protein
MGGSLREWGAEHREQIPSEPVRGVFHAVFTAYLGLWYTLTSRWPLGTHVYDEDWDLLVILDACRVDVLESVADEYDFIETVDSRWSVGSHSHEWLTQTFSEDYADEIANTAYVSGNGHTHETFVEREYPPDETVPFCWPNWRTVGTEDFGQLDMLWETAHQDELGVPPRAITDRTVEVARESDYDRLIAHYMQPHIPYIAGALAEDRSPTDIEAKGWKLLESGDADHDEVWQLYEDNLRLVLDEVKLLLENVDAENVVVTADHGNAFGEYTIHGHPEGMLLPCVKTVPWVETQASDEHTFEPTGSDVRQEREKTNIEDHLTDLGYL